jgi:non-ribosomal peptide synthase protein (TIGR01720 family)
LSGHPEAEVLQNSPYPQVLFNYLGRIGILLPGNAPFKPVENVSIGGERSTKGIRRYVFEINSFVQEEQLHLAWTYSQNIYRQETVKSLCENYLENLNRLISHCLEPDAGGFTPSDFPLADLDDRELDQLSDLLDQID